MHLGETTLNQHRYRCSPTCDIILTNTMDVRQGRKFSPLLLGKCGVLSSEQREDFHSPLDTSNKLRHPGSGKGYTCKCTNPLWVAT